MSFFALQPQNILEAAEAAGFEPTGEFTQLNSYENRVFDLKLEDTSERLIAKFYRPGRWSEDALKEEHEFLFDLQAEGLTVVPPMILKNKKTIMRHEGIYVSFFPKVLGRMPQEFLGNELKQVGRLVAHLHNVGSQKKFSHRPVIGQTLFSPWENLDMVSQKMAPEMWARYEEACIELIEASEDRLEPRSFIRIHGDCHKGNLLSNGKDFFFVDFVGHASDETVMAAIKRSDIAAFSEYQRGDRAGLLAVGSPQGCLFP